MKIDIIAGARPNFIKIAPIIEAIENFGEGKITYRLIHTGQHYDDKMSETFFRQLQIPKPHFNLNAGGGTQAEQTAAIMVGYEKLVMQEKYDVCLVVGDVTSTMACSIVAKKMCMKVVHVEGGIRSNDLEMPEEINRMLTDSISDYFYTTSETANNNLRKSGFAEQKIVFVGNTMIDTLLKNESKFFKPELFNENGLKAKNYLVLTLHRPSNVDNQDDLLLLLKEIMDNSENIPVIFAVHPRTKSKLAGINLAYPNLILTDPMSYLEFNYLVKNSKAVVTDSGGITEETTVFGVPCITLRNNTEREETITIGTNELIGTNPMNIKKSLEKLFKGGWKKGSIPPLWDGKTSERIIKHLLTIA